MSRPAGPNPGLPPRGNRTTTLELPTTTPQMVDALSLERLAVKRDAILWQRPIRLAALAMASVLALVSAAGGAMRALPVVIGVAVLYAAVVLLVARAVSRSGPASDARLSVLLVSADLLTLATLTWASGAPAEAGVMLVPALLVVQLAAYYHGRGLGIYCAVLATTAFLVVALVLPAWATGPRERVGHALFAAALFAIVAGALVSAHAGFRARMNQLRLFCRLVEEGELSPAMLVGRDRYPDDLTLLAKSFDTMRMRLAEQIGTDALTGCINRRALETRLRTEWRSAKRRGTTVAVLAIDIDHFKQINDTRGHPAGDLVLQELGGIFKTTARDTDSVARIGGDEFVVVLPDTGWQGALTFAERLRRKVEESSFGASAGGVRLSISVGVALARGTDPISPDVLLQEADRSLYKAKTAGRNRIFA